MSDIYCSISFESTDEILVALLTQYDFDSFVEEDNLTIGYIKESSLLPDIRSEIEELVKKYTNQFKWAVIAPENWNTAWEESFRPVVVGSFCQIRAEFHPPIEGISYDLIINPKMAFGTGHHATTFMMVEKMQHILFRDKAVFDFGCGTGILAILASKLGARDTLAIDIEEESFQNTLENAAINNVQNIRTVQGDLSILDSKEKFDVILANINRNILINEAEQLKSYLKEKGIILLSGILEKDVDLVHGTYNLLGYQSAHTTLRDGWACILMELK